MAGLIIGVLLDLRNDERDQPMMRLPLGGLQGLASQLRRHPFFNATPWVAVNSGSRLRRSGALDT
jgi:hypothetical protein